MNPKLPLSPFATWARIFNQTEGRFMLEPQTGDFALV